MSLRKKFENDPYFIEAVATVEQRMQEEKERKERLRKFERPTTREYLFQRRSLSDLPFIPDANSDLAIAAYIVLIPYITGILFLYFHLFHMDFERMYDLRHQHSFMLIWLIGYEVVAAIALTWIFKSIIMTLFNSRPRSESSHKRGKH